VRDKRVPWNNIPIVLVWKTTTVSRGYLIAVLSCVLEKLTNLFCGTKMLGIREEQHVLENWKFMGRIGPILHSKCKTPDRCRDAKQSGNEVILCILCRYIHTLQLPSHPDMTFAYNHLHVEHEKGFGIDFNPLDALKCVSEKNYIPKVAIADAWREARTAPDLPSPVVSNMFDWTFTTDYKGTLFANKHGCILEEVETIDRIDLNKLTSKEPILYYQDICLFEDELSDHGVAKLNVKIRCMRNNFFILMRFFLRVDRVLIRLIDTRVYYELGMNHLLREFCLRELKDASNLDVPTSVLTDPVALTEHLPIKESFSHKLMIPRE